jgi:hypothetical protein
MKIKEILDIPEKCFVGSSMSKTDFYNFAQLKSRDKKIFTESIDKITLVYTLQEENIRITPYKDKIREYTEVHIYNVSLKKMDKTDRIADIILRTIPYPMILVFEFENKIKLYVAHIKDHLADSEKITLEETISTNWININNLDNIDKKLFKSLQLENLSFSHFYKFYTDIVNNIIIYDVSKVVGRDLSPTVRLSPEEIKKIKDEIDRVDNEIKLKENQSKKETQINKQVDINIEIYKLKKEKEKLKKNLS